MILNKFVSFRKYLSTRRFRGFEAATLLRPRKKSISILGLGHSVGTPDEGITANVIVVNSFAELESRAKEVRSEGVP